MSSRNKTVSNTENKRKETFNTDKKNGIAKLKSLIKAEEVSIDFFAAVKQQDEKLIEEHTKNGVNIKQKNSQGFNALHMAAQMGNSRLVDLFLAEGVGINVLSRCKRTALCIAVEQHHIDIVKQLLYYGAKTECKNVAGDGLLHLAIRASSDPATRYQVVEALLAHGLSINEPNANRATPLRLALRKRCDVQLVDLLIKSGANIHAKDSLERSILHFAVCQNLHEVASKLLALGANPNDYDCQRRGILAEAIQLNNEQMVRTLLKYGADPTKKWAVHVAAQRGYLPIMKILLDYGANINNKRKGESTPLYRAIEFEQYLMVRYLLINGAEINTTDFSNSPLRKAITSFTNPTITNKNWEDIVLQMTKHIALMVARGQYVQEENLQLIRKYSNNAFDTFSKELTDMKNTTLKGTNVLYFDLLNKPKDALIDCLRSKSAREAIESKDHWKLFPQYSRVLEHNCLPAIRDCAW